MAILQMYKGFVQLYATVSGTESVSLKYHMGAKNDCRKRSRLNEMGKQSDQVPRWKREKKLQYTVSEWCQVKTFHWEVSIIVSMRWELGSEYTTDTERSRINEKMLTPLSLYIDVIPMTQRDKSGFHNPDYKQ